VEERFDLSLNSDVGARLELQVAPGAAIQVVGQGSLDVFGASVMPSMRLL
jgi:hypothetical protein